MKPAGIFFLSLAALPLLAVFALATDEDAYAPAPEQKPYFDLLRVEKAWRVTRGSADCALGIIDSGFDNMSMFLDENLLGRDPRFVRRIDEAFEYAAKHDVLIVLGAGNSGALVENYPGTPETVLVAGACDLEGKRWESTVKHNGMKIKQGSCYGKRLSVMAPSVNLYMAVPHEKAFYVFEDSPVGKEKAPFKGGYELTPQGATSLATTIVSSLAGLVRSLRPDLKTAEVIHIIQKGAVDLGEKGFDRYTGYGRVDFAATLALARGWPAKGRDTRAEK